MKLEMARGLFIFGALAIATVAVAALEQPSTQILTTQHGEDIARCRVWPRVW